MEATLCFLSDPPSRSARDLRAGTSSELSGVLSVKSSARDRLFVGVVVVGMLDPELEVEGARRDRRDAGREGPGLGVDIGVDADRIERP